MNDTLKKLQILGRAQSALIGAQLRRSVQKLVIVAVGLVFALLALSVLNYAAFAGLEVHMGAPVAALLLGLFDMLVAALLFAKGLAEQPSSDEELLAKEITDLVTEGLSADLDEARSEVRDFMRETKRLGEFVHQITSIVGGPVAQFLKMVAQIFAPPEPKD